METPRQKLPENEIKVVFKSTVIPALKERQSVLEHNNYVESIRTRLDDVTMKLHDEFVTKEQNTSTSAYRAYVWKATHSLLSNLPKRRDPLDEAIDSLVGSFSPIDPQALLNPRDTQVITSQTVKSEP